MASVHFATSDFPRRRNGSKNIFLMVVSEELLESLS